MILLQLLIGPRFMSSFARRQSSSRRLYNGECGTCGGDAAEWHRGMAID